MTLKQADKLTDLACLVAPQVDNGSNTTFFREQTHEGETQLALPEDLLGFTLQHKYQHIAHANRE